LKPATITTERLVLSPLLPSDATQRYANWFDDPEVVQHINAARSPHDVASLRQYITSKAADSRVLFLGIFALENMLHIGNLKFEPVDTGSRYAIAGIMIGDPAWRGKGVANEAMGAAGEWLARELDIREIALGVTLNNIGAQRAYLKSGFQFEKLDYLRFDESYAKTMVKRLAHGLNSSG
jgi:[ribosomal protein S5]-alanine N-acetyltransferase